jgi:hypothetical protein
MQPQMLVEEVGDFSVRAPLAAQFADQFAMRLQFGARRLGGKPANSAMTV